MARGKGSLRSLASITAPLCQYIAVWHQRDTQQRTWHRLRVSRPDFTVHDLPPVLQLAAIRGQGVLYEQFFGTARTQFGGQLPHQPTPEQWLDYHQRFIVQKGYILDLVRRIGLISALAQETRLPEQVHEELAFALYTALLDELKNQNEWGLLETATTRFFVHLWKQQFPTLGESFARTAKPAANQTALESLKNKARILLKKHVGHQAQLKETWTEQDSLIVFTLKLKPTPHEPWQDYLTIERPRLKPARLAAWEMVAKKLKEYRSNSA